MVNKPPPPQSKEKSGFRSILRTFSKSSLSKSSVSISAPEEESLGKRLLGKLLNKPQSKPASQSASPFRLGTSTQSLHGKTTFVATPQDGHHTPSTMSKLPPAAGPSNVQDLDEFSAQLSPRRVTSPGQPRVFVDNPVRTITNPRVTPPKTGTTIMEKVELTGRFLQTLVTKAASIVDNNPAKLALGLANAIIEAKKVVGNNRDTVQRRIESTGAQLEAVAEVLAERRLASSTVKQPWVDQFTQTLAKEIKELIKLRDGSSFRRILDHEDEQQRIADIFERVNEARVQFELAINMRVFKNVYEMNNQLKKALLKDLIPSKIADHKYHLESKVERQLRREVCTPGTRVRILDDIVMWAKNTSSDNPNVYWLFGPAGTGKSTIAYSIARRFEFAGDNSDMIILGGNFFCSRQFEETRLSKCIVRTIAYHLAMKCKAFADELRDSGDFDTVNQNVGAQLEGLLLTPWQASESARRPDPSSASPPHYLIVIDALDEIDGTGSSEFLHDLLDAINKNKNRLKGLKFFVTSRQDQDLVALVESLKHKRLYRLQDVAEVEVQADIVTYLTTSRLHLNGHSEVKQLADLAAGLFIYAATVVKYLEIRVRSEQREFLEKLIASSKSPTSQPLPIATPFASLDQLYAQILDEAFYGFIPGESDWVDRLSILHTFLCTAEQTSTSVVANILFTSEKTDVADSLLSRLHAVLYAKNDKILWYHKSFPDFIFTKDRSKDFWCDQTVHHRLLTTSCFRVMKSGLRFNIADIPSSYVLDKDNIKLLNEVKRRVLPVLSYSCQNWDHHLRATTSTPFDPFFDTLSKFLQLRVLFWIEVMNLLKLRSRCDPMLRTAREWVISSQDNLQLAENLAEAGSFALYFSGSEASASTPHLYISALATWPRNSDLWRGWKSHFRGLPAFTNASLGGKSLMTLTLNDPVHAVAVSRDGKHIASGFYRTGLVQVWDASSGDKLKEFKGHTSHVTSVTFSPDGKHIISGSDDKSVRVWNVSTGRELKKLMGHTDTVTSIALSSDGKHIVSGSDDKSVRVWDASTGSKLKELKGHTSYVTSVAFSPDGKHIVSGSRDTSVRVWDVPTGVELGDFVGHSDVVTSVAFSPDSKQIVSGSRDTTIRVWDASTGDQPKELKGHTSYITSVTFSPDGDRIISCSSDKTVRVWDALTGDGLKELKGHADVVTSVALSPDGKYIISGSRDKSVQVWDTSTNDNSKEFVGHSDCVTSVAFSPDGKQIVSGSRDTSAWVWGASTGDKLKELKGHTSEVTSVTFSPDGKHVVSCSNDNSLRVWDASTGSKLKELKGHTSYVRSLAFSPDGRHIVTGSNDDSIRIWEVATGRELKVLKGHSSNVTAVAFLPQGKHIISGSLDASIRVWDMSTGSQLKVLKSHKHVVSSVASLSDGNRIAFGSWDNSVYVWDVSTGHKLKALKGHTSHVTSVALSPDGKYLVSGSGDKSVRVWDISTGGQLKVLAGHIDTVSSVAFSPDGKHIVSGSNDRSIRVWDLSMDDELKGHTNSFVSPPFTPDSRRVIPSLDDNSARAWDLGSWYIREKIPGSRRPDEHTGWLLSPNGQARLMFVPPGALLPDASNILTMPRSARSYVDFTRATLGTRWKKCYRP